MRAICTPLFPQVTHGHISIKWNPLEDTEAKAVLFRIRIKAVSSAFEAVKDLLIKDLAVDLDSG